MVQISTASLNIIEKHVNQKKFKTVKSVKLVESISLICLTLVFIPFSPVFLVVWLTFEIS